MREMPSKTERKALTHTLFLNYVYFSLCTTVLSTVCLCPTCMPDGHRAQKREADLLELEFQPEPHSWILLLLFCFVLSYEQFSTIGH